MATIQIERRADGAFMRLERFCLPGCGFFSRRYVLVSGKEYELVGNFQCKFLSTLRSSDTPPIHVCVATDNGEGRLEVIGPEYQAPFGKTVCCRHVCRYKKHLANRALDWNCNSRQLTPSEARMLDVLNHADTIELNPEVLALESEG